MSTPNIPNSVICARKFVMNAMPWAGCTDTATTSRRSVDPVESLMLDQWFGKIEEIVFGKSVFLWNVASFPVERPVL